MMHCMTFSSTEGFYVCHIAQYVSRVNYNCQYPLYFVSCVYHIQISTIMCNWGRINRKLQIL